MNYIFNYNNLTASNSRYVQKYGLYCIENAYLN